MDYFYIYSIRHLIRLKIYISRISMKNNLKIHSTPNFQADIGLTIYYCNKSY